MICAHRLLWLLGCIAFLNDHSHCLWGHMHSTLHQIYAPIFRRTYLREFMRLPPQEVEAIMQRERTPPGVQPQPVPARSLATDANATETSAEVGPSSSDAPSISMPSTPPPPQSQPTLSSEQQQELFAQMTARIAALEAKLAQHEAATAAATAAAPAAAASSHSLSLSISPSGALTDDIVNLFAQQQGTNGEQRGH